MKTLQLDDSYFTSTVMSLLAAAISIVSVRLFSGSSASFSSVFPSDAFVTAELAPLAASVTAALGAVEKPPNVAGGLKEVSGGTTPRLKPRNGLEAGAENNPAEPLEAGVGAAVEVVVVEKRPEFRAGTAGVAAVGPTGVRVGTFPPDCGRLLCL
jgi:hypothetical protein